MKAGWRWTLKLSSFYLITWGNFQFDYIYIYFRSAQWISKQQERLLLFLGKKLGVLGRHHTAQIVWCTIIFDPSVNRWFLRIKGQAHPSAHICNPRTGAARLQWDCLKKKAKHSVQSQFPKERAVTEWNQRRATAFLLLSLAREEWDSLGVLQPIWEAGCFCPQPATSTRKGPWVYSPSHT